MKKNLIIFSLMLSLTVIPSLVLANSEARSFGDYSNYSVSELEILIAKLQKQLLEVKKITSYACQITDKNLSLGDGDEDGLSGDIKTVQNFLAEKGYFLVKSTGYFGKYTKSALSRFQKDMSLGQTGELDNETRAKIKTLTCRKIYKIELKKETEKEKILLGKVSAIRVTGSGNKINWTVSGGESKLGFKVVWSKNSAPTYPTREGDKYQYLSDPGTRSATLEAFGGAGAYRVRVCEYLGGACGIYSNEISLEL